MKTLGQVSGRKRQRVQVVRSGLAFPAKKVAVADKFKKAMYNRMVDRVQKILREAGVTEEEVLADFEAHRKTRC
ncbi:hypothetical protein [Calditerricola satsumensis]|uniref:Uncharacterized protein n=1 Tax=Calditerricola satsumensis TaxID=373054 RepID=A0A8J3BBP5_9BACI|nr:hypothetical protein [Calditerricola satsumensis]GGJ95967.1 hypothetical protein GCM10007043_07230 [Calditerricola satsumensis]